MKAVHGLGVALGLVLVSATAFAKPKPNIDAFGARTGASQNDAAVRQSARDLVNPGSSIHTESRLGVPTFLWVGKGAAAARSSLRPRVAVRGDDNKVAAARAALSDYASLYGLSVLDLNSVAVSHVHDVGRGPIVVKFRQHINGIPVFREEIGVVMNRDLEPIALSGYVASALTPGARSGARVFSLDAAAAAAVAVNDATGARISPHQLVPAGHSGGYDYYLLPDTSPAGLVEPVRIKKVYFHLPEGIEAGYFAEVIARSGDVPEHVLSVDGPVPRNVEGYGYVVSAANGGVLFRKNLTNDAGGHGPREANTAPHMGTNNFTYRVWADPATGIPRDTPAGNDPHPKPIPVPDGFQAPFVPMDDVTLQSLEFSQNDPWLPETATETVGNNVDAFANLFTPDGYGPSTTVPSDPPTGDFRAQLTGPKQFLNTHIPEVNTNSAAGRQASVQQLFYNINFLHDWFYDSGFDESAGNAQTDNYGRGGLGNDNIRGQAQDFASFYNANMLTPADGTRPRMRMYNFIHSENRLEITAPAEIEDIVNIGIAVGGPSAFDVTAEIVTATFTGTTAACTLDNGPALVGKIGLYNFADNGACNFGNRARAIMAAGAAGVLMVYIVGNPTVVANITGAASGFTAPLGVLSWNSAAPIKAQLTAGNPVTGRLVRLADRDGALDNQIVAHEWGHYLSNRLVANASGLNTNHSGGMGEGWGDFTALMLTVRPEDALVASNTSFNGAYALATYASLPFYVPIWTGLGNDVYYYGIRRYPMSTDMSIFPLTFKHIQDGVPLPVGPPVAFGADGLDNAEVHNTGEVWAQMLWECYAALLRDTLGDSPRLTFAEAQDRMKLYLVAGLKMTPSSPTFTEARDAVLAAAYATDAADYALFWEAFAKRGAGLGAVSPDRFSLDNIPVIESFTTGPELAFVNATLDDDVASCDSDDRLDSGEIGTLHVTLRNVGTTSLSGTTATITSTTDGITFPNGNVIELPATDPTGVTAGTVHVMLAAGISTIEAIELEIAYTDTSMGGEPAIATASFRGNADDIGAASATDDVETLATVWTTVSAAPFGEVAPWYRVQVDALDNEWHGDDTGAGSDEQLVSPVFTVDGSGSFNVQFDHEWTFEADPSGNYDGGVVEMSVNGGAWDDIDTSVYNGTLINYTGNVNPLRGLPAFVASSAGSVHTSLTAAIAPGSTVQVRFRIGTDEAVGAPGWDVDNIAFTGVVETPFGVVVADDGCTTLPTHTTLETSANPSPLGAELTLTATVTGAGTVDTGTVTFYDGATPLGSSPVVDGTATLVTDDLTLGTHSLTATFGGGGAYAPSVSNAVSQTIGKAAASVELTSSLNPSNVGDAVTFTATVTSAAGTPTGSVTFHDGATLLGTRALTAGVATLQTSALEGGTHAIKATYLGNATYAGGSDTLDQDVTTGSALDFAAATHYVLESAGTVTIEVTRSGGVTTGSATVKYATWEGTAEAGVRFEHASGTLEFGPGELTKSFDVTLLDDSTIQGKQSFTVTIFDPYAAVLGSTTTATVNVLDNDTVKSDFSGTPDGSIDIVLRNSVNGDLLVWMMDGTDQVDELELPRLGTSWRLVGVGDFNADGKADLLWRNSATFATVIAYMNGTSMTSFQTTQSVPDPNWNVAAVGDLSGDGYPDIVWRNNVTFQQVIWTMRENVLLQVFQIPSVPDLNWQMIGLGDFTDDGQLDMVWRHQNSGVTAIWEMDGTTVVQALPLTVFGEPWILVGVGDLNGDGNADLVWHNKTTLANVVWIMDVNTVVDEVALPTAAPDWLIVAPR